MYKPAGTYFVLADHTAFGFANDVEFCRHLVAEVGVAASPPSALYHDPAILVLDEATSSLDTPTEREVMEAVYALHGSKTIVIVAHRLSTVEHCDRLFRLEAGRVVESGTPETMLNSVVNA